MAFLLHFIIFLARQLISLFRSVFPALFPSSPSKFISKQTVFYKKSRNELQEIPLKTLLKVNPNIENFPFILGFNLHVRISKLICI